MTTTTDQAIDLVREIEYATFLREKSELELERIVAFGDIDKERFNIKADEIRAGFLAKREREKMTSL
jgi:hypothetical protein